jgi:hypothetical protein
MTVNPPTHNQINDLSLTDLRRLQFGSLPQRKAEKFTHLASRTPLELIDILADFAFLGKTTRNVNADKFMRQLCQLSGTANDGNIIEFQPELAEVKISNFEPARQVLFLKPIKASIKTGDQFVIQSPVIIYDSGSEISVVRPLLSNPEKFLITTIPKDLYTEDKAQSDLVTFMNLVDEENLPFNIRFVSGIEFASTVCNAVKEKMKSL